ncbi:MAG: SMP-30/gluconolactonase/LRE family protein [Planctomycetota bacterium]|nr:SMP-30/gluconolactonase/LRE family protein [Planctomycetota bacterium]
MRSPIGPRLFALFCAAIVPLAITTVARAEHDGKVQILLLGDSTTIGSVCRQTDPQGPHLEDVIRLQLATDKQLPPTNVINHGRDGEFIHGLLTGGRYEKEIRPLPGIDFILIRYGLNDLGRREKFAENFPQDLRTLIAKLRGDFPQATIIPVTIIPYLSAENDATINAAIQQAVDAEKLELFDLYTRYAAELKHGQNMLNYRRYPLSKIPEAQRDWLKPFVKGDAVVVMDNRLDAHFRDLPGWFSDRHPNLAGYHVIGDETAKYLAPRIKAKTGGGTVSSLVEPGAKVIKLAGDMKFTEGPVWLPVEKKLVFSDIPASQLMQWQEGKGLSVFRKSEQSNGNLLDLEGRLLSCQHAARNVVRTEPDGTITVLVDKFDGKRFNSPNDVAVKSDGTLWFFVFRFDPKSGKVDAVIKDLAMPNGIIFSPDESRLYVSDTGGHPKHPDPAFHKLAAGVHCYEMTKEGTFGKKLFTINEGSDGMDVDVKGNLYITNGKVKIYDVDGKLLEQIDTPEGPANLCFGGDDYKTLFITAQKSLYSVRMVNAGAKPKGAKW